MHDEKVLCIRLVVLLLIFHDPCVLETASIRSVDGSGVCVSGESGQRTLPYDWFFTVYDECSHVGSSAGYSSVFPDVQLLEINHVFGNPSARFFSYESLQLFHFCRAQVASVYNSVSAYHSVVLDDQFAYVVKDVVYVFALVRQIAVDVWNNRVFIQIISYHFRDEIVDALVVCHPIAHCIDK